MRPPVLLVAAAVLVLSGCGGQASETAPESAASPASDPLVGAPEIGACRDVDASDLDSATLDGLVPCSDPHTSRVVAVTELPDGLTPSSSPEELAQLSFEECAQPGAEAIGGNQVLRRTSLFELVFSLPDDADQADGAAWMACDVVALDDEGLVELPEATPFLSPAAGDDQPLSRYAVCVRLEADDSTTLVGCDEEHALESAVVLEFPDRETAEAADTLAQCRQEAGPAGPPVLGANPPKPSSFDGGEPWIVVCLQFDEEDGTVRG